MILKHVQLEEVNQEQLRNTHDAFDAIGRVRELFGNDESEKLLQHARDSDEHFCIAVSCNGLASVFKAYERRADKVLLGMFIEGYTIIIENGKIYEGNAAAIAYGSSTVLDAEIRFADPMDNAATLWLEDTDSYLS